MSSAKNTGVVKEYVVASCHVDEQHPGMKFDHVVLAHNYHDALKYLAEARIKEKQSPEFAKPVEESPGLYTHEVIASMHYYSHRPYTENELK